MSTIDAGRENGHDSTDLEERDRRALKQYLTVLDGVGRARGADGLYLVVSQSGSEYLVDAREGTCGCKDAEYRSPTGGCKHVRRVAFATGERPIPASVDDVDEQLGRHVDAAPRRAVADGGVILEEDSDTDTWEGPITEYSKYGEPTGDRYYRCRDCGREVHEEIDRETVAHREGCEVGR